MNYFNCPYLSKLIFKLIRIIVKINDIVDIDKDEENIDDSDEDNDSNYDYSAYYNEDKWIEIRDIKKVGLGLV